MLETHRDRRPTILLNDLREGYTIFVEGHEGCPFYAHTRETYDCGCRLVRERDCDATITRYRVEHCDDHLYEPRIIIYNEV